ncbi:MAG TPA: phosphoribosylamine--glycine ligase [Gemmatimonadales bacterium]|nr:phosphoribosylamine--glycine ligase [Gemmatimonadales bacterium]
MRLLVVGSGGREHALCHALRRENPDADLYCAPGNPGTAQTATNLAIAADDLDRLADAADMHGIDLTVVGPEVPLARGLADRLRAEGRAVFGPGAAAAQLEASKAFAKEVMAAAGIPTASSRTFHELGPALTYVASHPEPLVVKASGLAAGKGAVVCESRSEAAAAVGSMLGDGLFGDAGRTVVIESFLRGEEVSVLAITDGTEVELLPVSQDHKRLLEGDAGPNTGGMGGYSPVSVATPELLARARHEVLLPTLAEMRRRGTPFTGVLYAGLMVDDDGTPWVVEFNCRLGDPETQVVLPLVADGFTRSLWAVARGEPPTPVELLPGAASVTTVLASRGYPDAPEKGAAITIPASLPDGVTVFHAGTSRDPDGVLRVNGGRVLNVTAVAPAFPEAQRLSRETAEAIEYDGKIFRRDIGWREASRLSATR